MTVNGAKMLRHGHLRFSLPVFEINAIFAEKNLNEVCLKLVIFTVL